MEILEPMIESTLEDALKEFKQIINRALEITNNDRDEAEKLASNWIQEDPSLVNSLIRYCVQQQTKDQINHQSNTKRKNDFYKEPNYVPTSPKGTSGEDLEKNKKEKLSSSKKVAQEVLMNLPFNLCKKRLGDMNSEDIDMEVDMFYNNERGNRIWRIFLNEVDKKLGESNSVKDVYTEKELQKIKKKSLSQLEKEFK